VKVVVSVVEDAVLCAAAKVVVKLAWRASPVATMVVGASGAVTSCEACIWCSLCRRRSCGAPGLLAVGRSVPR
jgi:NAD/NADP transhydrogenase beta subunit